jgi:pyrroline-5-carboxylate reductase
MMTTPPKIVFLGAGNMASALIHGALTSGKLHADDIAATDVREQAVSELKRTLHIHTFTNNVEACAWANVIVLAVKPQVLPALLSELHGRLGDDKLVVSIVTGIATAQISAQLGGRARIVRAVPNTPAMVHEGATAVAKGPSSTDADLELVETLFAASGLVVRVQEHLLDAVTALSGSGPAYMFIAIEALADAGVREGLTRDVATQLAAQTLLGAGKMVLELGEHPGKLKDMVTSPGGTTSAAIAALEREGFRNALHAAVHAAATRAREMGS